MPKQSSPTMIEIQSRARVTPEIANKIRAHAKAQGVPLDGIVEQAIVEFVTKRAVP